MPELETLTEAYEIVDNAWMKQETDTQSYASQKTKRVREYIQLRHDIVCIMLETR